MTAATPAVGGSWSLLAASPSCLAGLRRPVRRACSSCWAPSRVRLSTTWCWPSVRPSPTPSCGGSCDIQPVRVAAGVQGGWIEATICDQALRPPSLPDEPLRAWAVADRAVVDELRFAKARSGTLVILRRCIPLVGAPRPIGAVGMTVPAADDGHHRAPGNRRLNGQSMHPRVGSRPACRTGKLAATLVGKAARPPSRLAAEIA
jgi:hypothetical protein